MRRRSVRRRTTVRRPKTVTVRQHIRRRRNGTVSIVRRHRRARPR